VDIYYGIWSMMINWPITLRAAVVVGVLFFLIYIFWPAIFMLVALILRVLDLLIKGIYMVLCFLIQLFYYLGLHKAVVKITNGLSAAMHRTSSILLKSSEYAFHAKRFRVYKYAVVYLICILLIGIPGLLKGVVSAKYMDTVACVRNLYLSMEQGTVEKAKQYDPLIKPSKTKKKKSTEAEKKEKQEESEEILLSLTGEGISGANIRSGPGTEYDSIAVVKGEQKLWYLGREDSWIRVRTEEGQEGWISQKIVTGLPEQ
jgi:hypothetical protein